MTRNSNVYEKRPEYVFISQKRCAYVAGCADYVATTIQEALDIYE